MGIVLDGLIGSTSGPPIGGIFGNPQSPRDHYARELASREYNRLAGLPNTHSTVADIRSIAAIPAAVLWREFVTKSHLLRNTIVYDPLPNPIRYRRAGLLAAWGVRRIRWRLRNDPEQPHLSRR